MCVRILSESLKDAKRSLRGEEQLDLYSAMSPLLERAISSKPCQEGATFPRARRRRLRSILSKVGNSRYGIPGEMAVQVKSVSKYGKTKIRNDDLGPVERCREALESTQMRLTPRDQRLGLKIEDFGHAAAGQTSTKNDTKSASKLILILHSDMIMQLNFERSVRN
jgi:hypothetical protein